MLSDVLLQLKNCMVHRGHLMTHLFTAVQSDMVANLYINIGKLAIGKISAFRPQGAPVRSPALSRFEHLCDFLSCLS